MKQKENMQIFLILGWKCENLWIFFDVQEHFWKRFFECFNGYVTNHRHLSRAYEAFFSDGMKYVQRFDICEPMSYKTAMENENNLGFTLFQSK